MRTIDSAAIEAFLKGHLKRGRGTSEKIESAVKRMLSDVRSKGDRALISYTERFDGVRLTLSNIRIREVEIKKACRHTDKGIVDTIRLSAKRIRDFHKRQKERSWFFKDNKSILGQMIRPIQRAGIYVPGGKASYPSTVLMNAIPAQVAGVEEIAMCVPAPGGEINPYVLAAADILGLKEIYRVGGAQAIGAMAYGTETIKKVDKIVGPGNIYVATAKRMVFGVVDIDMIAGPSEILIIADDSADASFIASDLLSQAEHDEMAASILITSSSRLSEEVLKELRRQLKTLKRRDIAQKAIRDNGAIILTRDLDEAVDIANRIAPEHLEVMTKKPMALLRKIKNAGAIFLGPWTPEPLGDYVAGPNHTLPTGGTARFSSPLGVYDFIKRSSVLQFDRADFDALSDAVIKLSDVEGLEAHGNSIRIRRGRA